MPPKVRAESRSKVSEFIPGNADNFTTRPPPTAEIQIRKCSSRKIYLLRLYCLGSCRGSCRKPCRKINEEAATASKCDSVVAHDRFSRRAGQVSLLYSRSDARDEPSQIWLQNVKLFNRGDIDSESSSFWANSYAAPTNPRLPNDLKFTCTKREEKCAFSEVIILCNTCAATRSLRDSH